MLIGKRLESDWLDRGTWTVYTLPYRHGTWLQLKPRFFGKLEKKLSTRDHEKLVMFRNVSVKFQKLFGKNENDRLEHI